jgi:di/tricarboxylate transporter
MDMAEDSNGHGASSRAPNARETSSSAQSLEAESTFVDIAEPLLKRREYSTDNHDNNRAMAATAEQRRQFGWQAGQFLNCAKQFIHKRRIPLSCVFWLGLAAAAAMEYVTEIDPVAWFVLFVTVTTIVLLVGEVAKPLWVFLFSLFLLILGNHCFAPRVVISVEDAFSGFGNADVFAIGLLYVVSRGVKESTALRYLAMYVLGRPQSVRAALTRLLIPVVLISAFMNNTPIVAMLIPAVEQWACDCRLPSSKLLMPLSFAAILGGMCSKIGTSVNLIADSLYAQNRNKVAQTNEDIDGFSLFEVGFVGVPAATAGSALLFTCAQLTPAIVCRLGVLYMILFADALLPSKQSTIDLAQNELNSGQDEPISRDEQRSEETLFLTSMTVPPGSILIGQTIAESGVDTMERVQLQTISKSALVLACLLLVSRLCTTITLDPSTQ